MTLSRKEVDGILQRGEQTKNLKFSAYVGREVKYYTTIVGNQLYTFENKKGEQMFLIEDAGLNGPSYWILSINASGIETTRKNVLTTDLIEWL